MEVFALIGIFFSMLLAVVSIVIVWSFIEAVFDTHDKVKELYKKWRN